MSKHDTPCHDNPDQWFRGMPLNASQEATKRVIADTKDAIRICETCPVSTQCRELGMQEDNLPYGIWGGLLAGERLLMSGITVPPPDSPNRERHTQEIRSAYNLLYLIKPYLKPREVA